MCTNQTRSGDRRKQRHLRRLTTALIATSAISFASSVQAQSTGTIVWEDVDGIHGLYYPVVSPSFATPEADCDWQYDYAVSSGALYGFYAHSITVDGSGHLTCLMKWDEVGSIPHAHGDLSVEIVPGCYNASSGFTAWVWSGWATTCGTESFNVPFSSRPGGHDSCSQPTGGTTPFPIDVLSGAKQFVETDFSPTAGVALVRQYNSLPYGGLNNDPSLAIEVMPPQTMLLGTWDFDFDYRIGIATVTTNHEALLLFAPNGSYSEFAYNPTANSVQSQLSDPVQPNPQTDYKLQLVGTGPSNGFLSQDIISTTWALTDPNDTVWTLQTYQTPVSAGAYTKFAPIKSVDRQGVETDFTRDSYGNLLSASDVHGNTVSFDWLNDADGNKVVISEAHLPGGFAIKYDYDTTYGAAMPYRLTEVEYLNSSGTTVDSQTYVYAGGFPAEITSIKDNIGTTRWTVTYDSVGRATTSQGPSGVEAYNVSFSTPGTTFSRTVTDPLGKQSVYNYTRSNTSTYDPKLVGTTGVVSTNCPASATSNSFGTDQFASSSVDENGNTTTYTWDPRGLQDTVIEASGTSAARTTTTTWDATRRVPTQVVAPGVTTTFTYH